MGVVSKEKKKNSLLFNTDRQKWIRCYIPNVDLFFFQLQYIPKYYVSFA